MSKSGEAASSGHPPGAARAIASAVEQTTPGNALAGTARSPRWVLLRVGLTLVGLWVLAGWALESLSGTAITFSIAGLIGGVVLNQAALFLAALRLRATLAAFGVHISVGQSFAIHLRSLFYFFFVPLSVGLEVSRYLEIRRLDDRISAKRLLLALLLDRALGLVAALAVVALLAGAVWPDAVTGMLDPGWILVILASLLLLSLGALAHATLRRRILELMTAALAVGPRLVWPVVLSLAALLLVCASVYVMAAGSGIAVSPAVLTFSLSLSLLGMAVPVSLLGATLGEAAGIGTLTFLGLPPGAAVLLASTAYCGRLIGAIQGGVLQIWADTRPRREVYERLK